MTYGPNHRHVEGRLYSGHYSGTGYNRVRVCSCGAEDHDPEPPTWDDLMGWLDTYYPESIFPTLPDDPRRDSGARIVSLIRQLASLRAKLDAAESDAEKMRAQLAEVGGALAALAALEHVARGQGRHGLAIEIVQCVSSVRGALAQREASDG